MYTIYTLSSVFTAKKTPQCIWKGTLKQSPDTKTSIAPLVLKIPN